MIARSAIALAALALALPGLPDWRELIDLHPPVWVERWLYNPRERTGEGIERLAGEEEAAAGEARRAFEAAGRLAPDDPRVAYNTGTARLLAGHGDAVEALGQAAAAAPADLAAPAHYNLGTAQLAADDPAAAVAALKQALRLDPGNEDAKHNLELALRRLEERRLRSRSEQEAPDGDRPGEEERSDESGDGEDSGEPSEEQPSSGDDAGEGGQGDEQQGAEGGGQGSGSDPASAANQLARFEEQPDMTAAQAAALLEAVENLERAQLRQAAALAARAAGKEEEDW